MTTVERVIPPTIADDGSVHYSSVMSPSDDSIAVCHMVPDRVIPVIFVPGVTGSNLADAATKLPVWLANGPIGMASDWVGASAKTRKKKLDPKKTVVYYGGEIPSGTAQSEVELRRRGWGSVANMSYGVFLPWLENALNDGHQSTAGLRAKLMHQLVAESPGVSPLAYDEVALSYKYLLPVHAVGYNWLQSNADSAKTLNTQIEVFKDFYRRQGKMCEKVIIVTHSMGGLVARHYSEVDKHGENILGISHGVMPVTGSATAYKRVRAGSEGKAGPVLGPNEATMTAVFAQSPGPLELLPSHEYGMGWLKISDGDTLTPLPAKDPYSEIYVQRRKWWGLVRDDLINPLDPEKKSIDQDWESFASLIKYDVKPFHENLNGHFHSHTYAFYGDDKNHATWGDVIWKRRLPGPGLWNTKIPPIGGLMNQQPVSDDGEGTEIFHTLTSGGKIQGLAQADFLVLQDANENGDGTVPSRSGRALSGQPGVKACVPFLDVDHEGAYKKEPQQLFALWAVTKIIQNVKGTSLEYKE
jgi:hypothetical protein